MKTRKRLTLMPVIALAALSLMVSLPVFSSMNVHAASETHYANIIVQPGDSLWSIASAHTGDSADVQDTIDRITEANHLHGAIHPGQHLRIPG